MEPEAQNAPAASSSSEPNLASVMELFRQQLDAAAKRDAQLTALLSTVLQAPPSHSTASSSPRPAPPKPVTTERPMLLSTATLSDFASWEEAWKDFSQCQHLGSQDRETRLSAVRQSLDEDLRRYIRQGVIPLPTSPDVPDVLSALKAYLRRQRNPLLDRISFYQRRQQRGESFDAFYTSITELFQACAFSDGTLCSSCQHRMCSACRDSFSERNAEVMRDLIVIGIRDDETRHKLLAKSSLTLKDALLICRAEEAAAQTNDTIAAPALHQVNQTRRQTAYRKRIQGRPPSSPATSKSSPHAQQAQTSPSKPRGKCPNCGGHEHTKNSCPAAGRTCNGCRRKGHFQSMCPEASSPSPHGKARKIGRLSLNRTSAGPATVNVATRLSTEDVSVDLGWLPDTGSDVDAIGLRQLTALGGFPQNLAPDLDSVYTADGRLLSSVGKIDADLCIGSNTIITTLHVYDGLCDALLSRLSLSALGFLPPGWPQHVRRAASPPSQPSPAEIAQARIDLLAEFADVFNETELRPMHGPAMDIILQPDARPHRVNGARPIPFAFRDQIKQQLDGMLADGIIEAVTEPTDWCHPIVIVNKKGTSEKRLTVDLRKLNDRVSRPTHPMTTPRDALSAIGPAQYFTTLDARHGYWQIPLSDDAKPLTTFITPWGRYRFRRNPQGLISAGDEFNRRTDAAFANLTNFVKVVDDCLVHDDDFVTHLKHVRDVLLRAREHGITFSARKFIFGESDVPFCGYVVGRTGWTLDKSKTDAIRDFPVPLNRTDLRSFFGLVNQCSSFSDRLSELCSPLRPLLKTSYEFVWDETHTAAFTLVKDALVSPPVLAHFQLGPPLRLETDASVLHGLGYALWQLQGDHWCLLECGSRFLSDAESRYAVIELECLAVVWATKKCGLFLQGTSFELVTDHRPLVPILNDYSLDQIENPRLQRLALKLRPYQLHASWRKGTANAFADALSRHPVAEPTPEDEYGEDPALSGPSIRACLRHDDDSSHISDLRLHKLQQAAGDDPEYQQLLQTILIGFPDTRDHLPLSLRPFWNGHEHLSADHGLVLKGERIVVPRSLRRSVLHDLHAAHQGLTRTKQRARQTVFWPGITNDIDNVVRSCPACRFYSASQQKEPMLISERDADLPFQSASADLFACQGWQYLSYVDRKTGWPCLSKAGRSADSSTVIRLLRRWFAELGVPNVLFTDGGPQFASRRFAEFCDHWQIQHVMSSPHYPQSNGHAEAAVKAMKTLILKTTRDGNLDTDAFQRGLLEFRNTPRLNGHSPAQALLGRPLESFLFAHRTHFASEWKDKSSTMDKCTPSASSAKQNYDKSARPLHELDVGTSVDIQDPKTKRWSRSGTIVAIGSHRDYTLKLPSGRLLRRNRRFLRPRVLPAPMPVESPASAPSAPKTPDPPRRSYRRRQPPCRLDIQSTRGQSYD